MSSTSIPNQARFAKDEWKNEGWGAIKFFKINHKMPKKNLNFLYVWYGYFFLQKNKHFVAEIYEMMKKFFGE